MFRITRCHKILVDHIRSEKGFSLAEVLIGTLISFFIISGIWAIYELSWVWWHEQAPVAEAQQIARGAISDIIDGTMDATAGDETVGTRSFRKRNGIAGAKAYVIGSPSNRMDFGLEVDAEGTTPRYFRLTTDAATGLNIVQYKNSSGTTKDLRGTLGITDLQFAVLSAGKVIGVTVTVQKSGLPGKPPVIISYTDYAYLRNYRT